MNNSMYVLKRLLPGALLAIQLLDNTHAAQPVVNLIHPTNGAAFLTGQPIRLIANATDADGTVSYVEFFAGLQNLGRADEPTTNGLYERFWFGPSSGMYQVRAEAVDDMGGRSVSAPVPITVSGLGGVTPELDPISNLSILEDAGSQTVALSGIGPGDTNASGPLTIIAVTTNTNLISNPVINYTSPNAHGSLIFTPVANAFGTAVITVLVNNGQPLSNMVARSFIVTVVPVNDVPVISAITDRTINENTSTGPIAFAVQDVETPASSLIVSGSSSNPTLVPSANLAFGGSGTNRALTVIPAPDQSGTTTITIVAQDEAGGTASSSFSLTVGALPMIRVISVSPETGVDLTIHGLAGRTHIVECSEDTVTWTPINTAEMPQAGSMPVRDASATFVASRFYRVIELP